MDKIILLENSVVGHVGHQDIVPRWNSRCYRCKHVFEPKEPIVYLATSSSRRHGIYHSKFCIPCVLLMLFDDTKRLDDAINDFREGRR